MENKIQFPTAFPIMHSNRISLLEYSLNDAEDLFQLRSDTDFLKYLGSPAMKDNLEAIEKINFNMNSYKTNSGISWKICLKNSNKLIGYIGFWRIIQEHFRAEIGFGIHADYQNKGYMKEACNLVLNYGFESLNIHSVLADVDKNNTPSIKLLKSQGFQQEGILRESFYFEGEFIDSVYYGLLKKDFK